MNWPCCRFAIGNPFEQMGLFDVAAKKPTPPKRPPTLPKRPPTKVKRPPADAAQEAADAAQEAADKGQEAADEAQAEAQAADTEAAQGHANDGSRSSSSSRPESKAKQRSVREIEAMVTKWMGSVQPRATGYFLGLKSEAILTMIAERTKSGDDPVDRHCQDCVIWQGWSDYEYGGWVDELNCEAGPNAAILKVANLGNRSEIFDYVFVSQLMVFMFTSPEVFEKMTHNEIYSFPTTCGNRLCVNVNHFFVPEPSC